MFNPVFPPMLTIAAGCASPGFAGADGCDGQVFLVGGDGRHGIDTFSVK